MISREHRFHGLGSLRNTYTRGGVVRGRDIMLRYQLHPKRKTYRAAVVVSKKVSKSAVVRNRIRRRIYEVIRMSEPNIDRPYEFIFMVFSDQFTDLTAARLDSIVTGLMKKAGIINR